MVERTQYECIDPRLGGELWRLDDPTTEVAVVEKLRLHCEFCAACRLLRAVETATAAGLRDGRLTLTAPRVHRRDLFPWLTGAGAAAMAAGLAMVMLLPPPAPRTALSTRAGEPVAAIERPVSNEVVNGSRLELAWTPLEGARAYEVSVRAVDGDFAWTGRSETARLELPSDADLPAGERFRVAVAPVPAYLAPAGGLRGTFRTGGVTDVVAYRIRSGASPGRAVGVAGLLALVAGLAGAVWTRRS